MTTEDAAHDAIRASLYNTFRARPRPLLVEPHRVTPAASLWSAARLWTNTFRELGLKPGDRLVLALPPSRANLAATIAAFWNRLTLCPLPPNDADDTDPALEHFDARLAIAPHTNHPAKLAPGADGCPANTPNPRRNTLPTTPDTALILSTTGSASAEPKRIAISHANLLAQLSSHAAALAHTPDAVLISALPWNHAFGMLVDLWPALLNSATVILDPARGKDPDATIATALDFHAQHLSAVPLQIKRIADAHRGDEVLTSLTGGVVGGAPADQRTAEILAHTKLRPGYGQTEASPGITLGQPGVWRPRLLGTPLACEVAITPDHEITITGPNVAHGSWSPRKGFIPRDRNTPLRTGDLAEHTPEGLVFLGRTDHRFKLANGHMIDAPHLENALADALASHPNTAATPVFLPGAGNTLDIALLGARNTPDNLTLRRAIGDATRLVNTVIALPDNPSLRTPKGDPNRTAIAREVARQRAPRLAA